MASDVQKKQINIALVGVRPADQITLKGYLRVLLSLDADLHWLAATEPNIHLFMINQEFRSASSVTKLLEINKDAAVLFIDRTEVGDGGLTQNQLTLPLKQISELHEWLVRHVSVLAGTEVVRSQHTQKTESPVAPAIEPVAPKPIINEPKTTLNNAFSLPKEFIEFIKIYQSRSQSVFELVVGGHSVAIIDTKRQLVWEQANPQKLSNDLHFRVFGGSVPDAKFSKDASDWLWRWALREFRVLLPLVSFQQKYQIRYWAKPPVAEIRRELLAVMTAMEKTPLAIAEIAGRASVSIETTQKVVAALLFSGNLMPEAYDTLEAKVVVETPAAPIVPQVPVAPSTPVQDQEKEEKMGFLSRLRKKLGI